MIINNCFKDLFIFSDRGSRQFDLNFIFSFWPPSFGIASCVRTVWAVMCLQTWCSPAICFSASSDLWTTCCDLQSRIYTKHIRCIFWSKVSLDPDGDWTWDLSILSCPLCHLSYHARVQFYICLVQFFCHFWSLGVLFH